MIFHDFTYHTYIYTFKLINYFICDIFPPFICRLILPLFTSPPKDQTPILL